MNKYMNRKTRNIMGVYLIGFLLASAELPGIMKSLYNPQTSMTKQIAKANHQPSVTYKRASVKSIYDGPFKHGSPMRTHEEDGVALTDCFASFHLPTGSQQFSDAI